VPWVVKKYEAYNVEKTKKFSGVVPWGDWGIQTLVFGDVSDVSSRMSVALSVVHWRV